MLLKRCHDAAFSRSLTSALKTRRKVWTAHVAMAAAGSMHYKLGEAATLELTRGDLTRFDGDAIVNAANERMLGGGGVDGAIHRAAGRDLYHACREVEEVERGMRCPTGEARITPGYNLAAKHVIHTVGPIYDDAETSAPLLEAAHRSCMRLANEHGLKSIAFPAISCGIYGYPLRDAAEIALRTVQEEAGSVAEVYFFLHDPRAWTAFTETAAAILEPCKEEPAPEDGAPADGPASVGGQLPAAAETRDATKSSNGEAAADAGDASKPGDEEAAADTRVAGQLSNEEAAADTGDASKPSGEESAADTRDASKPSDEKAAAPTRSAASEDPTAAGDAFDSDSRGMGEKQAASAGPAVGLAAAVDVDAPIEAESAKKL